MALPQAVCVNCNLSTRSDMKKCLHGNHDWATKKKVEPKQTVFVFGKVKRTYERQVIQ